MDATILLDSFTIALYIVFQGLYHESYDNACVMFATVVHFDEFFKMSSDYDRGHQCLRLLNEIIGDFDMVSISRKITDPSKSLIIAMMVL